MTVPTPGGAFDLTLIPEYVGAVGALGIASFGVVEAIGKTLFVFDLPGGRRVAGLPYVGFNKIQALIRLVGPALEVSYGRDYVRLIRQQYRARRSKGQAPETIRQGVRLGLPFLSQHAAAEVIRAVWGLPESNALQLAAALSQAPGSDATSPPSPAAEDESSAPAPAPAALAARFATALDSRVQAAFDIAEQVYETRAQFWAGCVAIGLSLGYQGATSAWTIPTSGAQFGQWGIALLIGLVAVPLAPAAKDLSTSLSDALTALNKIRKPTGT
jgi:hypothetical protein